MGAKIAVTIGIVSRGNEPFLGECLRAVASQNLDGLEVIVADISDEGGRQELFTNWLGKRQKCLYRHLPRCAAGAAKNYLLETAAGEYIVFLGEDICYLPGGLEKLYAQAKESGADMVIGRAAGGSFGGKEYPAAWTVDGALVPQKEPFAAEDIGERALLLCKGWSGDKLFRSAYLRESGLRFGEGAFSSVPFVFGTLVCGKTAVSKEPVLYTQDVECVKYRRSPKKSASDIQAAMLALEAMLKKEGKWEAFEKSFRTWCIEFAVWNYNVAPAEGKAEVRAAIREQIEPWLKITEHGVSDYLTRKRFFKYCELCSEDDEKKVARRFVEFDKAKKVISIWGCCVSREFFNVDKEAFCVNGYVFQVPPNIYYNTLPVSVNKIPYEVIDRVDLPGIWKQSAYYNFNKMPIIHLKEHPADYLLIDIADVRLDRYRVVIREDGVKTRVTQGNRAMKCMDACIESGYTEGLEPEIYPWFQDGEHIFSAEDWEQIIAHFSSDLKKLYPTNHIILNQPRYSRCYTDDGYLYSFHKDKYFEDMERLFDFLQDLLSKKLRGCRYMPMPEHTYSTAKHRLGLHTFHYCKTAEEYKMRALKKIVFEHASNGQIQQLCDEYDKKLEQELNSLQPAEPAGGEQ